MEKRYAMINQGIDVTQGREARARLRDRTGYAVVGGRQVRSDADLHEIFENTRFTQRGLRYDPKTQSRQKSGFLKRALLTAVVAGGALAALAGVGYLADRALKQDEAYQKKIEQYHEDSRAIREFHEKNPGAQTFGTLPGGEYVSYNGE